MLEEVWAGLAVAFGSGMLIGIDRERDKDQGGHQEPAGIRSFTLAALAGAMAQTQGDALVVAIGALSVLMLAAIAYWRSYTQDPGLITELSLFATYLIGVLAVRSPALGAGCAAAVAALLASRERLHRLSTELLSDREVRDIVMLAALALVVVPLVPDRAMPWLGHMNLRSLAVLVVLILALQGAGHVATRWLGQHPGLAAAGFFSGFVSSTATVATMGTKARAQPDHPWPYAAAGVMSTAATWVQALVMTAAIAPGAVPLLAPVCAAGAVAALAGGLLLMRHAGHGKLEAVPVESQALRLREALVVAGLLSLVALLVSWAQEHFGASGLYASIALAALADAHAPVASTAALFGAGSIGAATLVLCVLLALSCNAGSRTVVAAVAGGPRYAAAVGASLLASTLWAWAVAAVMGTLS
ncbi:MgtC/SapB family protein [Caldimonas thermodepolymerans]|jgi:uncharacterized membrane protein (DUF4010 family)|uniref:Uncharacterized membrane protein (DUF4010 family) n=1 Tax=Caldimonas thermodepolymerans TaxID=215580 RepID=A0AA46DGV8_9BURK|nr:DUF4010 domain-containing protein [Caldimonas thermodepolymerans]TCP09567.1 uncharacterized membrane protein (DUF4010 family) [Caldimonas thermodepolymerans]UZG49587.1 DUF4010 domain-containing protein [Caldimonas thermodepolymerans]